MRVLIVLASAGMLGGALAVQACGAGDDATAGDVPAAEEGGVREAGSPDVSEGEPRCDPKANLLAKVRDASIADGASTTGICLGCAKAKCEYAITKCTEDCPCQGIMGSALECYLTTQQLGCAGALADILVTPTTRKYGLLLLGCAQNECRLECAVDAGAAADASAVDASDAGGEAG